MVVQQTMEARRWPWYPVSPMDAHQCGGGWYPFLAGEGPRGLECSGGWQKQSDGPEGTWTVRQVADQLLSDFLGLRSQWLQKLL